MRSVLGRDNCSAIGLGLEVRGWISVRATRAAGKIEPECPLDTKPCQFPTGSETSSGHQLQLCGRRNLNENRNQDIF